MIYLHHSQGAGKEQDHTQFTVVILWDDTTCCDEMGEYFATEADKMKYILCEVDLNKEWF